LACQITVRNLETIWKGSRHLSAMPSGIMSGRFSISAFASNYLPSNPTAKLERGNLVKGETEISRQNRLSFYAFFCGIRLTGELTRLAWSNLFLADMDCDLAGSDHKTKRKRLSI
jgi:hypothetical protein